MEIRELRLGNYVLYNGMICVVSSIIEPTPTKDRFNNKYVISLWNNGSFNATIDEIEPIVITEEILLKFGFEDQEFSDEDGNKIYMLHHKKFYLTSDESCMFSEVFLPIYSNDCVSVKYVHQLQNLFYSLTGEELTVKN